MFGRLRSTMVLPGISFVLGGAVGYVRGVHAVHETIVAMNREFGWACGTGLEMTVAAYTSGFAMLAGMLTVVAQALIAWRTRRTTDDIQLP
jgi:hypothetical protein